MTNISLHVYVCVYIYHIFFICSSVDRHLGCFHILAIVNSAAVNIEMQMYLFELLFEFFFFFLIFPRLELLSDMVVLFLVF